MRVTSTSECARARAAATPPKPAPTITTRFRAPDPSAARGKAAPSEGREASDGRVLTSFNALLIVLPRPGLASSYKCPERMRVALIVKRLPARPSCAIRAGPAGLRHAGP